MLPKEDTPEHQVDLLSTPQLTTPQRDKRNFLKRVIGTVLRQTPKLEPEPVQVDERVLEDIDDFIKNNNLYMAENEVVLVSNNLTHKCFK